MLNQNQDQPKSYFLLVNALCLGIISLSLIWGVDAAYFQRQLFFWAISIVAFLVILKLNFRPSQLAETSVPLYLISLFFLLLPLIFGAIVRGSSRWIFIKEFSIQPSELTKPAIIMIIAYFLSKLDLGKLKSLGFITIVIGIPTIFIAAQPDLGSAITLALTGGIMVLFSQTRKVWLAIAIGFFAVTAIFGWRFLLADYQKERVEFFLHPEKDPLGKGYNLIQTKITIGSGGFFGRGLATGSQTRLEFLPERHTDFIFAVLAESFGFLGVAVVLGLFFTLFYQIHKKIQESEDEFNLLFKTGLGFYLWFQTMVNVGMNLGVFPITGLPLPFFSYGGSSLLSSMIALALIAK